ncbi:hypothetical protein C2G38_2231539 [Gigaspora rosea]|uniref:Uncharacterized protein n=1 Tax=Gigaspora rosea TaxID=44941 RepID=A0A397TUW9_9GLOM|nr:hypothetical protein C2G38_2231539 [Gigaspora rosea]
MKCKDSDNSSSFNNNEVEDIKVNGMLIDNRKVKVELWIFLMLMKLHMMNDLVRRADKDGIGCSDLRFARAYPQVGEDVTGNFVT